MATVDLDPVGLLVNGQGAAHQRFSCGQPVSGLEQLRQVVEADGDVGMRGAIGLLGDGQGAAHGAVRPRPGDWCVGVTCAKVVEADGDVGMVGAVGLLGDGQGAAHAAVGCGQAIGGLEQPRQVVEAGDAGWSGP